MKDKVIIQWENGDLQVFPTIEEAAEYLQFHTDIEYKANDRSYYWMYRFWTEMIVTPMVTFYSKQIRTITVKDVIRVEVRGRGVHYFGTQEELNHFMRMLGASFNGDVKVGTRYYLNGLEIIIRREDVINTSWNFNDWGDHF